MRLLSAFLVILSGCMVFDESMRRPRPNDAGANDASADDGGTSEAGPDDAGADSPSDGPPIDPAVCTMAVPAGSGGGNCGGNGSGSYNGESETEPNDVTAQALTRRKIVCGAVDGQDTDRYAFTVAAKDCYEIVFQTDGAIAVVTAPSAAPQTFDTDRQVGFQAAAAGSVEVTINGKGRYRLLLR